MNALLPFWLLIAPPVALLIDSMLSKGGTSTMGARAGTAAGATTTAVRR